MKKVFIKRNGRKEYTREEIAHALVSLGSNEPENNCDEGKITYFLHIDDEGNIIGGTEGERYCFTYTIPIKDYNISEQDIEKYGFDDDGNFAWWDSSFIPDRENLDCKPFAECVDGLTDEVNEWLKHDGLWRLCKIYGIDY